MKIKKIYSTRKSNQAVYSDLIYEWEDDYAKYLNAHIYSYRKNCFRILNRLFRLLHTFKMDVIIQKIEKFRRVKSLILVYELYPRKYFSYQVFSNKVPIIIDFDYYVELKNFYSVYKNCPIIFISNKEAYNYLKSDNCPLNIQHLPLGIAEKYTINLSSMEEKKFDVIVTRSNRVLVGYLQKYSEENSNFEFIVRKWKDKLYVDNNYYSNKKGNIGEFSNRDSYLKLLRKAKIALYTTPGIDEDQKRFMNHITPSLFEFISSGCKIIARYPKNAETDFFNLEEISKSVESYEEFKTILEVYLKDNTHTYLKKYDDFLQNIYIKKQAPILQNTIETLYK